MQSISCKVEYLFKKQTNIYMLKCVLKKKRFKHQLHLSSLNCNIHFLLAEVLKNTALSFTKSINIYQLFLQCLFSNRLGKIAEIGHNFIFKIKMMIYHHLNAYQSTSSSYSKNCSSIVSINHTKLSNYINARILVQLSKQPFLNMKRFLLRIKLLCCY